MSIMSKKGDVASEKNNAILRKAVEEKIAGANVDDDGLYCRVLDKSVREKMKEVEHNLTFDEIVQREEKVKAILEGYRKEAEEAVKKGMTIAR